LFYGVEHGLLIPEPLNSGETDRETGNNKLQAPNYNIQILNKIKSHLFGILNFGHCDLPFDLAQGGEVVSLSNHLVFGICYLKFLNAKTLNLKPCVPYNMLSDKMGCRSLQPEYIH
jgi:hypothetical protein